MAQRVNAPSTRLALVHGNPRNDHEFAAVLERLPPDMDWRDAAASFARFAGSG